MPASNYAIMPYESDGSASAAITTARIDWALVNFARDFLVDTCNVALSGISTGALGCGLYDPKTLSAIVRFPMLNAGVVTRTFTLRVPVIIKAGSYLWASGANGAALTSFVTTQAQLRNTVGLVGSSALLCDAAGNLPPNLGSVFFQLSVNSVRAILL